MEEILTEQADLNSGLATCYVTFLNYKTEIITLISQGYFKKKLYNACKVFGTVPAKEQVLKKVA